MYSLFKECRADMIFIKSQFRGLNRDTNDLAHKLELLLNLVDPEPKIIRRKKLAMITKKYSSLEQDANEALISKFRSNMKAHLNQSLDESRQRNNAREMNNSSIFNNTLPLKAPNYITLERRFIGRSNSHHVENRRKLQTSEFSNSNEIVLNASQYRYAEPIRKIAKPLSSSLSNVIDLKSSNKWQGKVENLPFYNQQHIEV